MRRTFLLIATMVAFIVFSENSKCQTLSMIGSTDGNDIIPYVELTSGIQYMFSLTIVKANPNERVYLQWPNGEQVDLIDGKSENFEIVKASKSDKQTTIKVFGKIKGIDCSIMKLSDIRFHNLGDYLEILDCKANSLNSIDLSTLNNLRKLDVSKNKIEVLDLSKCSKLEELRCFVNQIVDIDLHSLSQMKALGCWDNQIKNLDLSNCPNLFIVNCANNQLLSLDVSKNLLLESITCKNNKIKSLDFSNNLLLKDLDFSGNDIDVEHMESLIGSLNNKIFINETGKDKGKEISKKATLNNPALYSPDHDNICTKRQIAWAEAKNWDVIYQDNDHSWVSCEGIDEDDTYPVSLETNDLGMIKIKDMTSEQLKYVKVGKKLEVIDLPNEGNYQLTSLTANGVDILKDRSFTVNGATVIKAVFSDVTSAKSIANDGVTIVCDNGVIIISCHPNDYISLYDLSGRELYNGNADTKGHFEISSKGLFGAYLLNIGGNVKKINM